MSAEMQLRSTLLELDSSGAIDSLPILILNVHENCNCKCSMCDIWKRAAGSEVSLDTIRAYQNSIKTLGVRQVVLTGGEPLLHSQLRELCILLKQCGVHVTLLSTGLLLGKKAEIIADHIDEVIVSLDGPPDIHNAIRGVPRVFELLRNGIRSLRQMREDLPIHARSTIQKANFRHLRATVESASHIGCHTISFLAVDTSSQAFNRDLIWPIERQQKIGLSSDDVEILEEELELLIAQHTGDFESGFIVETPEKLRRIASYFRRALGEIPFSSPTCNAPWVSAVVEVDGSVRPCFFHRKVGNTNMLPLHEAVNTEEARAFRQTLNIEENPICQRCVCSLNYRF